MPGDNDAYDEAGNAHTLAEQLVAERQQLEAANARHEQWVAGSSLRGDAAHGTWPGAGRPLAGRGFDAAVPGL